MTAFIDSFSSYLTPQVTERIGSATGTDPKLVRKGLGIIGPLVVAVAARAARSPGGLQSLLDKLPGSQALGAAAKQGIDDRMLRRQIALIDSMTPRERRFPDLIDASRKRRIASGAGMQVQDINRLLKQFVQMQKMMKKMAGGGLQRMMRGMGGRLPPGGLH